MPNSMFQRTFNAVFNSVRFCRLYIQRCQHDQIGMIGGYLAYISILSLVPLVAVAFSVLNAFPMFAGLRGEIEAFVYANIVPSRGLRNSVVY